MKTEYSFITRVENTPFSIIQTFDKKYAITIGNNVVTTPKDTMKECMRLIEVRDWELITNSVCALFNIIKESNKNEAKNEKDTH